MYLDSQEGPQKLPEAFHPIEELPATERRLPRIQDLIIEIQNRLLENTAIKSIVLAGEGEPTLRLEDLVDLVELVKKLKSELPVRVTTNGLVTSDDVAQKLVESGVSKVSVALMTAEADQYDKLMHPMVDNAHWHVCQFIEQAIQAGLDVETTAIDREDVDKEKTEELSRSLRVTSPIRWRTYFE
jgi:TatD family-associated radical SAM protein